MAGTSKEKAALWKRRHEEYRSSGLSRKAFCQRFKLKVSTLDYWFARLRRQVRPVGLVELKGMATRGAAAGSLTLVVAGGVRVEIATGCDMELLREVLGVLGSPR